MITNGFTYIAFLMFVAGTLLFLQKNTKQYDSVRHSYGARVCDCL